MNAEQIAKTCHEVNRAYCQSIGDNTQVPWSDAPQWQKDSAINGVKAHIEKPRTPRESHELWSAEKRAAGWKCGPEKSAEAKTHPCLVDYGDLPERQRSKDYIFAAVVEALR